LPDISKINALAIGSVSKVDGLAKASILDIDGVAVPAAFLLDTYTGAAAAYSVRLLRTAYTGDIMRVRRDSDNVEADVGFDSNNELSLTSPISNTSDAQSYTDFADFVDHTGTPANGFVRTWYDQASSNDAEQSTEASQPKIYDSSTGLIEEGSVGNEKPAVQFDGSNDFLSNSSPTGFSGKSQSVFNVSLSQNPNAGDTEFFWALGDAAPSTGTLKSLTQEPYLRFQTTTQDYNSYHLTNSQNLYSLVCPGTVTTIDDYDLYRDGSFLTPDSLSGGTINNISAGLLVLGVNTAVSVGAYLDGNSQEFIFYNADQSSNRTGIETNINTYFSIY
jgi:hypothetical protein